MGTMGESPSLISKPAATIFSLKYYVFSSNWSLSCVDELSKSNTFIAAPTIDGAKELEKR